MHRNGTKQTNMFSACGKRAILVDRRHRSTPEQSTMEPLANERDKTRPQVASGVFRALEREHRPNASPLRLDDPRAAGEAYERCQHYSRAVVERQRPQRPPRPHEPARDAKRARRGRHPRSRPSPSCVCLTAPRERRSSPRCLSQLRRDCRAHSRTVQFHH